MVISYGEGAHLPGSTKAVPPESKFWDLAEQASRNSHVLSDWEGMADPAQAQALMEHPTVDSAINTLHTDNRLSAEADDGRFPTVDVDFIKDIVLHWIYENLDQTGYVPNPEEIANFIQQLDWLFRCRFWMKSSA